MIYREFLGEKLPLLGFGTMRLPTLPQSFLSPQREQVAYSAKSL